MELAIRAPRDGVVGAMHCKAGDLVPPGVNLLDLDMSALPSRVSIVEVGPRDGLQNETAVVPTAAKIAFVDRPDGGRPLAHRSRRRSCRRSGCRRWATRPTCSPASRESRASATARSCPIAPGSIGRWPPACARSRSSPPHPKPSAAATSTSRSTSRWRHTPTSPPRRSRRALTVRGYLSTSFGCPFEGDVDPARVAALTERLLALGVVRGGGQRHHRHRASRPGEARAGPRADAACRSIALALHFHDTRGTALANVLAALEYGVTTFDSAAGGLGGCPYAPGAAGQSRHRGSALPARRLGDRNRRLDRPR